jgi:hypothetical protein
MRLLLVAVACLSGCARHVVIDPQMVPSLNDRDWIVHHEPSQGPEAATDARGTRSRR